jgi:hypothetical protein
MRLLNELKAVEYTGRHFDLLQRGRKYNETVQNFNVVCPRPGLPYLPISPYLDLLPGGAPPDLGDFYLR